MPFADVIDKRYSNLVLHEAPEYISREYNRPITVAAAGALTQGTIVFRPVGIDASVPYEVLEDAADISDENEYAILIGDGYEPKETINFTTTGENEAILLVRTVRLKEARVIEVNQDLFDSASAAEWESLKLILANQTILVEPSLEAYPSAF